MYEFKDYTSADLVEMFHFFKSSYRRDILDELLRRNDLDQTSLCELVKRYEQEDIVKA
jgi:hypothetical protein